MSESLLPPNATQLERAIEDTVSEPIPVDNATLWNPDTCPARLLPWLAHALSVDVWDERWPEETKRRVIRESVQVHRRKGTVASIYRAMAAAGYPNARVFEEYGNARDGSITARDGSVRREGIDHWAEYRVYLTAPISIEQGAQVQRILADTAPARCRLVGLFYDQAAQLHDGTIEARDGTYTRGVV